MKTYLALFLVAAFGSAVLTPLLRRFCERHGLLDASLDQRRIHQRAVPRLGGVAIFISIVIALCSLALVHNLLTQTLRTELKPILSVLICGLLVLLIGAYDDLRGANATVKSSGRAGGPEPNRWFRADVVMGSRHHECFQSHRWRRWPRDWLCIVFFT